MVSLVPNMGQMRHNENPGKSLLCHSGVWRSRDSLPSFSTFQRLLNICFIYNGQGFELFLVGGRHNSVYSIFLEAEQVLPFILRLKTETLLSNEIVLAILKKIHQVEAKVYLESI